MAKSQANTFALAADRIAAQAAITSALSTATPTHVKDGKRPAAATVYEIEEFTAFESALFAVCEAIEASAYQADNMRAAVASAIRANYGDTSPTFAEYKHLQHAMQLQSAHAGYAPDTMRKHVAHGVKTAYGKLPESDSPAAIAKRAQRPGKQAKSAKTKATPAEAFQAGVAHAQENESIEQWITRVGMSSVLAAVGRILDAEDATKQDAAAVRAIVGKLAA